MIFGDSTPGNLNTNELAFNWQDFSIFLIIALCVVVLIVVILVVRYFKNNKKLYNVEHKQEELSDDERQLITEYRKLDTSNKIAVRELLLMAQKDQPNLKDSIDKN